MLDRGHPTNGSTGTEARHECSYLPDVLKNGIEKMRYIRIEDQANKDDSPDGNGIGPVADYEVTHGDLVRNFVTSEEESEVEQEILAE